LFILSLSGAWGRDFGDSILENFGDGRAGVGYGRYGVGCGDAL